MFKLEKGSEMQPDAWSLTTYYSCQILIPSGLSKC